MGKSPSVYGYSSYMCTFPKGYSKTWSGSSFEYSEYLQKSIEEIIDNNTLGRAHEHNLLGVNRIKLAGLKHSSECS